MNKKVIIVGNDASGLISAVKELHPDSKVVTIDQAKELGLSETYEITNHYSYADYQSETLPLTRAQKRKNKRNSNKTK
ncbi:MULTISPECIES: hypothetical protein [Bizionia]|uniref:Uncharacterized protein n=1 Tax=Bizionia algoritergicola TaxID=291187 RepID=A0A5D0QK65_9FLAO|nr:MULTISPECIES: hypothetical protein [Bizionia]OBX17741.1 hypothetical protein BAA08_15875 [Bizionia sp. APA-3]TYB69477.1 hypothetical protein ES675_16100 [Bizionia algoritergicola]